MTITNGYCTLAELKAELAAETVDSVDDAVLERIIEDASRAIDAYCGRQFYASTGSAPRYYDVPDDEYLWLDADLLAAGSVWNGDGALISASNYSLFPRNSQSHNALALRKGSSVWWTTDANGNDDGVIAVSGSWGYVDRAATDAMSVRVVANTRRACLMLASAYYRKRFGQGADAATVTGAGVVLTPQGMPRDVAQLLEGYRWLP